MKYEVEMKFRVADRAALLAMLASRGVALADAETQADVYFAHPARDFAQTDEALRIRSVGSRNFVTYKGPKLDAATKTRQEIELAIAPGAEGAAGWSDLLAALGFRRVAEVRKERRHGQLTPRGARPGDVVELVVDDVAGLGTFVELERLATPETMDAARADVLACARDLGLAESERRSYLELLLTKGGMT